MASIFFALLIIVFFFFPLVTYIVFWYDTANSSYLEELARESDGRATNWVLKGLFSSILSQIIVLCSYPLVFVKRLWHPGSGDSTTSPPVILIHGLYHNASAWVFYRWWLRRAGYRRVYAFNYKSLKYGFWEVYQQLDEWMLEIGGSFRGEEIVMVGHSIGGLLAKAYAGRKNGTQGPKVRAVVTLGAPNRGTRMAVFGMGRLAKSLAYGTSLIRELEGIKIPSSVSYTALYSPVDNMVLPAESLKAPAGCKQEKTAPVCHVSMLYHGPTFKGVLSRIRAVNTAE